MAKLIIGQVFGILATVLTFLSYQCNRKRSLLIMQTASTASTCLGYLFLGASAGFALNLVCIARNFLFYFAKSGTRIYRLGTAATVAVMTLLGVLSWQGYASLLIITALAINSVYLSFGQPQRLRKSILLTSTMIIIYNVFVFSLGGIANETVAIVSSIIGIIRFRKDKTTDTASSSLTP